MSAGNDKREDKRPTHYVVPTPRISMRRLADYMAASPVRQRTLIRDTKFRSRRPEIAYSEGFDILGEMIADGELVTDTLFDAADHFYDRMDVRGSFERIRLDLIGDMFDWLAQDRPELTLPDADRYDMSRLWGRPGPFIVGGVEIDTEVHLRLRKMRRNAAAIGVVSLRYSKSGPLKPEVAQWQSALLHGYLEATVADEGLRPDPDLCVTLDLRAGLAHPAPGNARTMMRQVEAACASIAERWPAIQPSDRMVLGPPPRAELAVAE